MRTARRRAARVALLAAWSASLASLAPGIAPWVLAAEYTMETRATYEVRPQDREITVSVEVDFTNTTPDPAGQFSVFDEVKLAVHDQAAEVKATDGEGDLEVAVAVENEVNVATVQLREDLRYEETAELTVTWILPDSDDPQLRVRPSVVVFPAWGFGTSSQVTVRLPAGYEVRVDGDALSEEGEALVSGPIEDPSQWLSLVTAVQPADYRDFDATVPLTGGTADLLVRAFADDEAWGERMLAMLSDALPPLERAIGLPYPESGQLVITETVTSSNATFDDAASSGTEVAIAFDQPPFTALHQVAHVWISPRLVESRWLREGLASYFGAEVAGPLEVDLPFDPAERAEAQADAAFRLDTWAAPDGGADAEAYGYAASWAFVDELATTVGADALRAVLGRAAANVAPYQSADVDPTPLPDDVAMPATPLTTRLFLDHLETVSGKSVSERFAEVLTEADAALLPAREEARAAFAALVEAGGSWQAPDSVRAAMEAWEFDAAQDQMAEASAWLERRDELLASMEAVGLSAPDRLKEAYRTYGGGTEAVTELEAEQAVVDAYAETATEVNAERSFLERIGLIGGPDPATQLNLANGRFAEGDLRGAVDAVTEAQRIVSSAETGGMVRIASAVLLAALLLGIAVLLVRRRGAYTARR